MSDKIYEVQVGSGFFSKLSRAAKSAGAFLKKTGVVGKVAEATGHKNLAGAAQQLGYGERIYKVQIGAGFFNKILPAARKANAWFKKTKVLSTVADSVGRPGAAGALKQGGYGMRLKVIRAQRPGMKGSGLKLPSSNTDPSRRFS